MLDNRLKEIESQFPNIKKPSKDDLEIFYGEYGEGI